MKVTASQLRADIYNILDQILENGTPVEVTRKGKTLRIIATTERRKSRRRTSHKPAMIGNPEDFVHLDWSREWKGRE